MPKILLIICLVFGFSFTFWSLVGLIRLLSESAKKNFLGRETKLTCSKKTAAPNFIDRFTPSTGNKVAVCMAAFNEESIIADSLQALKKIIAPAHIYVSSDGSVDRTAELARAEGCQVLEISANHGKADALVAAINHFRLCENYDFILFVDADTRLREDYLINGLPYFDDPKIAAVAGFARTQWQDNIFIAYRSRVWFTIQTFFRFGMTWKFTNVNMIIPGFASMYRAKALLDIDIAKPGLVIEDFNMTFELQKKKLGKIAHHQNITGYTQDPYSFKSYCKQIKRWNLGFWQTVKANGFWLSLFWVNLSVYLLEMLSAGLTFLILPSLISFSLSALFLGLISPEFYYWGIVILKYLLILFALDYLFTIITAIANNRPELLFYGPTMLFFRWLDAYYFFTTLFLAFNTKINSNGTWQPPERWPKEAAPALNQ